jgi:hypothetical protein
MGVIYRLKPEIKNYILETKKANPALSCRKMVALIENKFQMRLSKSSINALFKESGLSMPVGRRRKKRCFVSKIAELISTQAKGLVLLSQTSQPIALQSIPPQAPVLPKPEEVAKVQPQAPVQPEELTPTKVQESAPSPALEASFVQTEIPPESIEFVQTEGLFTGLGAILLKAADGLMGGSRAISEVIRKRLKKEEKSLSAQTECLLYANLFNFSSDTEIKSDCGLWPLINQRFSYPKIAIYLNTLKEMLDLPLDILRTITSVLQEVRTLKISLPEGEFYLDGQLHTVWSTPQIPYDFSTTIYNIKSYINKCLQENAPFVLFMAPGYEMPTEEFFDFMLGLESTEKGALKLSLYGNKFEELLVMRSEQSPKHYFIFGLWPWQFVEYRKVKSIGEYSPFCFEALKKDFYVASVEIELLQPNINKRVILKGCALKTTLNDKIRLIILSNLPQETSAAALANLYLSHWPNLEEAFQDFSRKIELFTYTATSQHYFSTDKLDLNEEVSSDLNALFNYYLKALDLYVRWHFLPSGYEDKDFSTTKEQFYALSGQYQKQKDCLSITFIPPSDYRFLKDLAYACRRINEREIFLNGNRLWLF